MFRALAKADRNLKYLAEEGFEDAQLLSKVYSIGMLISSRFGPICLTIRCLRLYLMSMKKITYFLTILAVSASSVLAIPSFGDKCGDKCGDKAKESESAKNAE